MAYWGRRTRNLKGNELETITMGGGVNTALTPYTIPKSDAYDSRNTSSHNYPALSVRRGFTLSFGTGVTPLTTPNGATVRNATALHVVDGAVWKRWSGSEFVNVATGLTNSTANFLEFNRESDRLTLMFNGTDKKAYDGSTITDITQAPDTKLITLDDYRLYCLKDAKLQISAVNNPFDFTSFEDAVPNLVLAGMEGTETALASYQDMVIAWSDKTMHLLLGDRFDNFQLMDPIQAGCVSHRSVIEHNSRLYFMDYNKYKVFTGGFPVDVSQKVKVYLENINYTDKEKIVAGSQGKYIYLSIPYGSSATTNNLTLEYDTELGNWYPINKGYINFVNIGEALYGVTVTGTIEQINSGTLDAGTPIAWSHTTGVLSPVPVRSNKTLSNIWLELDLPTGSTMAVGFAANTDGETFTNIFNFTASADEQRARVQLPTNTLQNVERYRLRLSGTGPATVHFVEIEERLKAR